MFLSNARLQYQYSAGGCAEVDIEHQAPSAECENLRKRHKLVSYNHVGFFPKTVLATDISLGKANALPIFCS